MLKRLPKVMGRFSSKQSNVQNVEKQKPLIVEPIALQGIVGQFTPVLGYAAEEYLHGKLRIRPTKMYPYPYDVRIVGYPSEQFHKVHIAKLALHIN